jgi:hypothetical protein
MALILSLKCERRRKRHRRPKRYLLPGRQKSSKSGTFWTGKIIPLPTTRRRNDWNARVLLTVFKATRNREECMYIGLGGLLVLILILWLLGVI